MLKIDIFKRESWMVMEDDSKEEIYGEEVCNCMKGPGMRKPVLPPSKRGCQE